MTTYSSISKTVKNIFQLLEECSIITTLRSFEVRHRNEKRNRDHAF